MAYRKATVPLSFLPGRDPVTGNYRIRYRLITSDRNKVSEWSPIFTLTPKTAEELLGGSTVDSVAIASTDGGRASYTLTWTLPEIFHEFPYYDVYVSWDSEEYSYYNSTSIDSITVIVPSDSVATTLDIKVQIPTYPRAESAYALIFEADQITL